MMELILIVKNVKKFLVKIIILKINQKQKISYLKNILKFKECHHNYYLLNKEKILLKNNENYLKNKDLILKRTKIYMNVQYKINLNFKLRALLRQRIRGALKENWKSGNTIHLIGCSVKYLKKYLESKFKPGMNWDNHGKHGWHIDHIRPCASFDLSIPKEQAKCFHYTNLQPLWAEENLRKNPKKSIFKN